MPNSYDERFGKVEAKVEEIFREIAEMKETRREMNQHITTALDKLDIRTRAVEKYIWLAMGGLAVLQIAIAVFKK